MTVSNYQNIIAQVLIAHPDRMDGKCHGTGKPFEHQDEWAAHVADVIVKELGLQPHLAKRIINGKPDQWVRRLVTDWEIVE